MEKEREFNTNGQSNYEGGYKDGKKMEMEKNIIIID